MGQTKKWREDDRESADKACDHFTPDHSIDELTCANCLWTIGAHDYKAGGTSPVGKRPGQW